MESGILSPVDDFLIIPTAPDADVDLSTFWHSQYRLRFLPSGEPAAPSFIRPVASRILTTGKSVIFLQHLLPSITPESSNLTETEITFSDVIFPGADLAPFSSLFEAVFNHWISTRHRNISVRLRQQLFNCGLFRSLDALEHVFFANNGYLFSVLTSSIFAKLDRKAAAWRDRFLLTDLIQSVFSTVASIDAGNLRMGVATAAEPGVVSSRSWKDRVGKKNIHSLEALAIEYRLPWAVANILTPATSYPVYNSIFTFLLQLRRVRYLLERLPLRPPKEDHFRRPPKCYYRLKQMLLWFCNTVTAYVTDVVLAPQCAKLRAVLAHCVDVDALCAAHEAFLSTVVEQCLLGEKLAPIHRAVMGVLDSAVKFTRLCAVPEEEAEGGWKKRKRRRRKGDDDDDDEEEDSSDDNMEVPESPSSASSANSSLISQLDDGAEETDDEEGRYARRLERMRGVVEGLVGFIRTGLRGVSRAGVMPHLEMLAERVEGYGMG